VPDDELERIKRYLALGVPRRLETAAAMAVQLADLHLHGMDAQELVEFPRRVAAVRAEDVLDAARRWLDVDRMVIAVVGDAQRVRAPLAALGVGPVLDRTVTT
jgi:predicted Zn-dependent peptidase